MASLAGNLRYYDYTNKVPNLQVFSLVNIRCSLLHIKLSSPETLVYQGLVNFVAKLGFKIFLITCYYVSLVYSPERLLGGDGMSRTTTKLSFGLKKSFPSEQSSPEVIARSPQMLAILKMAEKVAATDCTVLISGESGVGKDVIARYIHAKSPRSESPFIKVNCGAIPETLLESELFGYERGAFTGASRDGKPGKFELARNGTIFLDEVGDLPLQLQVKLLHALQEKEIVRIGGTISRPVNARIIAATDRNLKEMVNNSKFREDLYFRLSVIPIYVPPLRERKEDIGPLVVYFKRKYEKKYNVFKTCSQELIQKFKTYEWPGNVRELENTIERIYVMIEGNKAVTPDMLIKNGLGFDSRLPNSREHLVTVNRIAPLQEILSLAEKQLLQMASEKYKGVKEIARVLGVDPSTVSRKLKKLALERETSIHPS